MRTDDLIAALAQDAAPPARPRRALALAVAGGALVAGALFFAGIGFRPDALAVLHTVRFPFKFVATLTLAAGAVGFASRLAQPGAPKRGWALALALAPLLLGAAVALELAFVPPADWMARLIGTNARNCLTIIPVLSIVPLALILAALRRGAPTRPALAGAVAGLAASGIAATFYAANCTDDSPLFVAFWYPIATALVVTAGALLGRRLLRW